MHKILLVAASLVTIVFSCLECSAQEFKISGSTEQLDQSWVAQTHYKPIDGNYVYLLKKIDGHETVIDSCILENSEFVFKGQVDNVEVLTIKIVKDTRFDIFVENKNITVEAPIEQYYVKHPIVKGSETDKLYRDYTNSLNEVYKPVIEFSKKIGKNPTPEQKKEYNTQRYRVKDLAKKFKYKFIEENKNSVISAYLLMQSLYGADPKVLEGYYSKFTKEVKNSSVGKELNSLIRSLYQLEEGSIAPDFTLLDFDGKKISLKDLRGKYVLIDFWGSYCGPCIKSFPHLKELYKRYKDRGFEIVGVTLDKDRAPWKAVLDKKDLPWMQLSSIGINTTVFEDYKVVGVPFTFLIDKNGRIIKKNPHGSQIDDALNSIFKQ